MQSPIITLTTDFGPDSPYVAQMKGVIYSINPDVRIVDVTHGVAPQDIRQGAWVWRDVMHAFPSDTIHIGVVDPGVGSDRHILCCQFDSGIFIGPDNGLISYVAAERTLRKAVSITNRRFMRPQVSHTFHGRDIMAPAAARLSLGTPMDDLGQPRAKLVKLLLDAPMIDEGKITGTIQFVDSFGNLLTNIPKSAVDEMPLDARVVTQVRDHRIEGLASCYAGRPAGEPLLLVGSNGMLEIAISGGNAAKQLGIGTGEVVEVLWDA
ncbi:MAG: SAM-dependent chlorinase/fluorinase [Planctomycetota bacterium]